MEMVNNSKSAKIQLGLEVAGQEDRREMGVGNHYSRAFREGPSKEQSFEMMPQ